MIKGPRFIEFQVITVVFLAGPDRMNSLAWMVPTPGISDLCSSSL